MIRLRLPLLLLAALPLAGCGGDAPAADPLANRDPAVTAALSDPIMGDPDLTGQNQAAAALTGGGPAEGGVPPLRHGPEEAGRAREAARALLSAALVPAPAPAQVLAASPLDGAVTAEAAARATGLAGAACAGKVSYGFGWAARLPAALAPYPRGHALEAAGSDAPGCALRAVRYVTAVSVADAVDFHHAEAASLAPQRRREGGDEVIAGRGFAIHVRPRADGLSEVWVISAGR